MTLEEAQKIGSLISNADGGCPVCVRSLCEIANKIFPEFTWSRQSDTAENYGDVLVVEREGAL